MSDQGDLNRLARALDEGEWRCDYCRRTASVLLNDDDDGVLKLCEKHLRMAWEEYEDQDHEDPDPPVAIVHLDQRVEAAASFELTVSPQRVVRPVRLFIDPLIAPCFDVLEVRIGVDVSIAGPVPAALFAVHEVSIDGTPVEVGGQRLPKACVMSPGMQIRIVVRNRVQHFEQQFRGAVIFEVIAW